MVIRPDFFALGDPPLDLSWLYIEKSLQGSSEWPGFLGWFVQVTLRFIRGYISNLHLGMEEATVVAAFDFQNSEAMKKKKT